MTKFVGEEIKRRMSPDAAAKCGRATQAPKEWMSKGHRNNDSLIPDDPFPVMRRKAVPHEFVLEALTPLSPRTRPMRPILKEPLCVPAS
jgi:hypothetical protein